ncbi:MAG: glycosyltransferase family 9 protein [Bacteroidetes bacterium]|nr:MAG: glycosyltransferase family 9 protein [Bacteroidota bacterium]
MKRILIVQIGRIGDMVLTTPVFDALAERFPEAELHLLASPKGAPVAAHDPRIARIHLHRKGVAGLVSSILALRRERFDVWVDPKDHPSTEGALLARWSGAPRRIGFNAEGSRAFTETVPSDRENVSLHAVERNLLALRTLGIERRGIVRPSLYIEKSAEEAVERDLNGAAAPAVVNISAGQATRRWKEEGWSAVIRYCFGKGMDVALAFQPSDAERAAAFKREFPRLIVPGSPGIGHAAALVKRAALVVTVDTAVVHLASAFDIPVVALYTNVPWNFAKFRPLSTRQEVLMSSEAESLLSVTAEAVVLKMEQLQQR